MHAPHIERIRLDDLDGWHIRLGDRELRILEQGAQVLSYRVGEAPPVIWLSDQAAFKHGQSVRGGVPVCWPWFGDLARNNEAVQAQYQGVQAPAHGLVRGLPWTLQSLEHDAHAVCLRFALDTRQQPLPGWPQACSLSLEVRLDQNLTLTLTSQNHGPAPLHLSQALHTYLAVSDIRNIEVQGLDGCQYLDAVDHWRACQQSGAVTFTAETDRVYQGVPTCLTVVDRAWQRRVHLQTQGSSSAVVWNPWVEKSLRLTQFAPEAWRGMLCVENANVMQDSLELSREQCHTLSVRISTQSLANE